MVFRVGVDGSKKGRSCKVWDKKLVKVVESGWRAGRRLGVAGRLQRHEFEWEGKVCEGEDLVCDWVAWLDGEAVEASQGASVVDLEPIDDADLPF